MNKILRIILLGFLFGCESDDFTNTLIFNGHVRNKDFELPTPSKNIKVEINYYGDFYNLLKTDSALTDDFGNYNFKILDDEAIKQYSIQLRDEYYFKCNGLFPAVNNFIIPRDIDKLKPNSDTLNICVTGKIEISVTKLNLAAKDTLTVSSTIKPGSFSIVSYPITITNSKQWTDYYFTKTLSVVEYKFVLKKENGELTNWKTEKELQPQVTNELMVTF